MRALGFGGAFLSFYLLALALELQVVAEVEVVINLISRVKDHLVEMADMAMVVALIVMVMEEYKEVVATEVLEEEGHTEEAIKARYELLLHHPNRRPGGVGPE